MAFEDDLTSISEVYHENTKDRVQVTPIMSMASQQRGLWYRAFKRYPHRPRHALDAPPPPARGGLEETIRKRRSVRDFTGEALTAGELSRLLFYAFGVTGTLQSGEISVPLRASPSAGALYPIELYPVAVNVKGLPCGVYHYDVEGHSLRLLREGDFSEQLYKHTHQQEMLRDCAVVFIMNAVFGRTKIKYGERGYRYVLLDAGHLAQNIYLEATALGLGCATVGGFVDEAVNQLTGADGLAESAVYIAVVGRPLAGGVECSRGDCPSAAESANPAD